MRIGPFEADFAFRQHISLAEVQGGHAELLQSVHLSNVRGNEQSWMTVSAEIGGKIIRRVSVRDISLADDAGARKNETKLKAGLLLPDTMKAGRYSGTLMIRHDENGEKQIPFQFEILASCWIPTDLLHAPLLAAWIHVEDDELRGFVSDVFRQEDFRDPVVCYRGVYESLRRKRLLYHPVSTTVYPDFEAVSDMHYVLDKGGSCADLSLLTASLLWICGLSPVLLLYKDHITAGCLTDPAAGTFETLEDNSEIFRLVSSGKMIVAESTGACAHDHLSFEKAVATAENRLQNDHSPCRLLNLKAILRKGSVHTLTADSTEQTPVCPVCGYDQFPASSENELTCPACRHTFSVRNKSHASGESVPEASGGVFVDPGTIRYAVIRQGACVQKCLDSTAEEIQLSSRWENKAVVRIEAKAFEHCKLQAIRPMDDIVSIGDYAFRDCACLETIQLSDILTELGAGAFSSSGLKSVRIPGSVRKIPVFAFSNCDNLKNVVIEEGVQNIDEKAFVHCPCLRQVRIPGSVKTVSKNAFDPGCRIIFESVHTRLV